MVKGRRIREKGKVKLSEYFKEIKEGSRVAVIKDAGHIMAFPKRILGRSGTVVKNRGNFKEVEVNVGNMKKTYLIHPVHLKAL